MAAKRPAAMALDGLRMDMVERGVEGMGSPVHKRLFLHWPRCLGQCGSPPLRSLTSEAGRGGGGYSLHHANLPWAR